MRCRMCEKEKGLFDFPDDYDGNYDVCLDCARSLFPPHRPEPPDESPVAEAPERGGHPARACADGRQRPGSGRRRREAASMLDAVRTFARAGAMYQAQFLEPNWRAFPDWERSRWEGLALFVSGYAFERQGRSPAYAPAAAAAVRESCGRSFDESAPGGRCLGRLLEEPER